MNNELRFEFGENWSRFLDVIDEKRIAGAKRSLKEVFDTESMAGKRFLDIGCGSGLFSLAARRLGAEVYSFDYDARSVACCLELKRRHFPEDTLWRIERGDVLSETYLKPLRQFDFVYSYGVLHHTGDMFKAQQDTGPPENVYFGAFIYTPVVPVVLEGPASRATVLLLERVRRGTGNVPVV